MGLAITQTNSGGLSFAVITQKLYDKLTPRHKIDTCRKNLEEYIFARVHVGPAFALSRTQENILEEFCICTFAPLTSVWKKSGCIHAHLVPIHQNIFGELISLRMHAAYVFAPGRIQESTPGELFMYWFRARGYVTVCNEARATT